MSDSFFATIKIGGSLDKEFGSDLVEVLDEINDSCEIPTEEDLIAMNTEPIECNGWLDVDSMNEILSFCKEQDLTVTIHASHSDKCEAEIIFWTPDMKDTRNIMSDDSGNTMAFTATLKPLLHILIDYCTMGESALPLHINHERHGELIKSILKAPDKFEEITKAYIDELMPEVPEIPPFILTEDEE